MTVLALLWFCLSFFITAGYVLEKKIDDFGGVIVFFLMCLFAPFWVVGLLAASVLWNNFDAALTYVKDFFSFNFPKK